MTQGQVITIMQDAILTVLVVSLPILGIGLIIGLLISVLQATTQINEQTIVFVSKIISVFLALLLFGPWILTQLQEFTVRIFEYMNTML